MDSVRSRLLALALVAVPVALHAQASLSLDAAVQLATRESQALVASRAQADAAREMAVAAGQRPDPVLKAGINNLPIDGADRFSLTRDFMTMRSIGVMQELTRQAKLSARSTRYLREADAANAARALTLANLRRDTATAWLNRWYEERVLELLKAQRAEAALQIEAADAAYRGNRGAQADVFAARSAAAQIDDRMRQTEREITTARTRLARWVGREAEQPLAPPPDLNTVRLDAGSVESHLIHHPEIVRMARQEEIARADADIAQSNQRPDWSVELMFSQRGPAYSNMVSVNVAIPLQLDPRNRQDRELSARLAVVEQMRAQREDALREHLAETHNWLQEWHSNRDRLANHDTTLIPLAAQRTQAALAAYRGGGGSLSAVLEARRAEIDTRMDRLRLEMETAGLWAQLKYLVPPVDDAPTEK
jgi:outer membrane protein TolC